MSSRLEDALIFVKPIPNCVTRIKLLENNEIACYVEGARQPLRILDSDGNEISSHDVPEQFVAVRGGILFFSYSPRIGGYRIDFLNGDEVREGERLKIDGYSPEFLCDGDSPDCFRIVASKSDKAGERVKVYDFIRNIATGEILPRKINSKAVPCNYGIRNAFVPQSDSRPSLDTFISMDNGDLYSVAPGKINWKIECHGRIDGCDESDRTLVLGSKSGQFVRAFKLEGEHRKPSKEPIWAHSAIGPVLSILIPDGKSALVGTEGFGGRLYAFDLKTGTEKFKHDMTKDFGVWTMAYSKGVLYLGTGIGGKGRLYALDYKALGISE